MDPNRTGRRVARWGIAAALAAPCASTAARAEFSWQGDTDDQFSNGNNWVGDIAPTDPVNDSLLFGAAGVTFLVNGQDADLTGITGISFTDAAGVYSINGIGSFSLVDGSFITNDSAFDHTINVDLRANGVSGIVSIAEDANLTYGGDIDVAFAGASQFTVSGSNDTTIDGVIEGVGGQLVKADSGTLTLTGNNTFTGGTTFSDGTIIVGHDNAFGTGDLTVTGVATLESDDDARAIANDIDTAQILTVDGDFDLTLDGNVTGDGGFTKTGDGTLTLNGTNSFSGVLTIQAGRVELDNGDAVDDDSNVALSNVAGAILELLDDETINALSGGGDDGGNVDLNGNTLTLATGNSMTYNGVISGTGSLEISNDGTILLTGNNTYSGGTTVTSAGATLGFGHDNAFGAGTLTLQQDVTLRPFGGTRTIGNAITVLGSKVTFAGSSAADFTGNVNLSGATREFRVTSSRDIELSGVVSNGGLRKSGNGTLILSGTNTYTGDTDIAAGDLRINGSIMSDADVRGGATLSGRGLITGDVRASRNGTVAPGDRGIGTLTIDGDYNQRPKGTLAVEVNSRTGNADLLDVSGSVTLGFGSVIDVSIKSQKFIQAGREWTIINADGGITDEGALIENDSATLKFTISRKETFEDGDTEYIIQALRDAGAFADAAVIGNNRRIGRAIDSLVPLANADPDGDAGSFLARLDLLGRSAYNDALEEISPEKFNIASSLAVVGVSEFTSAQTQYLATRRRDTSFSANAARPQAASLASGTTDPRVLASAIALQDQASGTWLSEDDPIGVYARGLGFLTDQTTTLNRTGYSGHAFGGQVGVDVALSSGAIAGFTVGFTDATADIELDFGDVDTETLLFGPYLSLHGDDGLFLDTGVLIGGTDVTARRDMRTLGLSARSDYDSDDLIGYAKFGKEWELNNDWTLTPALSLQYAYFDYSGFTETGAAGANLVVQPYSSNSVQSRLSATVTYEIKDDTFIDVVMGWQQEYAGPENVRASFITGGDAFEVDAGTRDEAHTFIGAGLAMPVGHVGTAYFRYEGVTAGDSESHAFAAGIHLRF